jgi:hypothetical protein
MDYRRPIRGLPWKSRGKTLNCSWRSGMNTAVKKVKNYPVITGVAVRAGKIIAILNDGREVSIPLSRFPRLLNATSIQQNRFEISPSGYGIHWPELDEDISVKAFID